MMNKENGYECGVSGDIVSYMYNEMDARERTAFEAHLLGCTVCTDEFAEVAHARYSVFEWHNEEFVPLTTPEIVIPYPARRPSAEQRAGTGLFTGLLDLLSASRWPAMTAAAVLLTLGVGLAAIGLLRGDVQQQAANHVEQTSQVVATQSVPAADPLPASKKELEDTTVVSANRSETRRNVRPVKTSLNAPRVRINREPASNGVNTENRDPKSATLTAAAAPVLTNFEDNDDGSLRLADLFDEGGS